MVFTYHVTTISDMFRLKTFSQYRTKFSLYSSSTAANDCILLTSPPLPTVILCRRLSLHPYPHSAACSYTPTLTSLTVPPPLPSLRCLSLHLYPRFAACLYTPTLTSLPVSAHSSGNHPVDF